MYISTYYILNNILGFDHYEFSMASFDYKYYILHIDSSVAMLEEAGRVDTSNINVLN